MMRLVPLLPVAAAALLVAASAYTALGVVDRPRLALAALPLLVALALYRRRGRSAAA